MQPNPAGPRRYSTVVAALALLALAAPADAQLGVAPTRFEVDLDEGPSTHSVRVLNLGQRGSLVEVEVLNFDLDEANKVRILPPDEQSLDQWMVLNPLRFEIPAGGSQAVRFSIRPRVEPATGEHRAMLYFTEVVDPDAPPTQGIRALHRIGIAVYAWAGEEVRSATVHGLTVAGGVARLDVEATGTAHVRCAGTWTVLTLGDPPANPASGELPSTPVLPGTRRTIPTPLPSDLGPGEHRILVEGTVGDAPLDLSATFVVPGPAGD